jgi:glutaredoxin
VPTLTLYGKPGCHLCEDARREIELARAELPIELEEVDVTLDAALHRRYGERIPVVEVDGEELFELRVDPHELRAALRRAAGTRPGRV